MTIWHVDSDLYLVADRATVIWLDLTSPFGDAPTGVDWTLTLPDGMTVADTTRRPRFGCGPDAHRPYVDRYDHTLALSFRGYLPGENQRRPMTNPDDWSELHFPLVIIADHRAQGGTIKVERRALGDSDVREFTVRVLEDPGESAAPTHRRCMQLLCYPWFSQEEQELLATTLHRCGINECSLNWHGSGLPTLPVDAYALAARTLRIAIPGVRIWIGGLPGADTALPRAQGRYGTRIPFVACPETAISDGADWVVAAERSWCEAVDADGVMIALTEPSATDTDAMPAHCFSLRSRSAFAREQGLEQAPDPLTILRRFREEWVDFSCRQMCRLIEVARLGHEGRPLAICAYGPDGPSRSQGSADWQQLRAIADIMVYSHVSQPQVAAGKVHWGYTRVSGTPQSWWERWHDPLGSLDDPSMAAADAKMQIAISGGQGVRIGSWASLDGRLQQALMAWR